jgi:uncharacterized membrane protein YhdT
MLNIWDANWGLELDLCPCDLHFVEYLAEETPVVFGMAWLFMAAICLMIGYIFVGVTLWVEKVMSKRGMFKDDGPTLLR